MPTEDFAWGGLELSDAARVWKVQLCEQLRTVLEGGQLRDEQEEPHRLQVRWRIGQRRKEVPRESLMYLRAQHDTRRVARD